MKFFGHANLCNLRLVVPQKFKGLLEIVDQLEDRCLGVLRPLGPRPRPLVLHLGSLWAPWSTPWVPRPLGSHLGPRAPWSTPWVPRPLGSRLGPRALWSTPWIPRPLGSRLGARALWSTPWIPRPLYTHLGFLCPLKFYLGSLGLLDPRLGLWPLGLHLGSLGPLLCQRAPGLHGPLGFLGPWSVYGPTGPLVHTCVP